jgi:hypothetical protein
MAGGRIIRRGKFRRKDLLSSLMAAALEAAIKL